MIYSGFRTIFVLQPHARAEKLLDVSQYTVEACMGFMALITTLVLYARSQDLVMSRQRIGYMSFFGLLDLRAEESRVVRHVKTPRCGKESRTPRALSRVRTQAVGALAPGSCPLSYPSAHTVDAIYTAFLRS